VTLKGEEHTHHLRSVVDDTNRQIGFLGAHSAQTLYPSPKLAYKWHIPGMSISPRNNSHHLKLCRLSCILTTSTPWIYPFCSVFGSWKTPCTEIQKFFTDICTQTPIHVFCFKNGRNHCKISG